MGIIRQLPQSIINQIAAGEVVERPASVVKELLENAIDAEATRIDLSVERGGKDLIRVADNGMGMSPDDLLLAFQPHATSKLAEADDLFRIRTLGFRGEALAAIAEVAKVRCQTRRADAGEGSELSIDAGDFGPIKNCGCSTGTVMEVRNLFQTIPVRRAFLKSDLTESGHVADMFSRIALAHPEVHLTYRSGNKVVYDLPPVPGTRERIATFFGRELAESLLWVEGRFEQMHLWGYVAHPSQSRASAKGQYLFVAGRYVRDRALGHALNEAYRGLLMVGRMPVAFLHLEIPPDEVDVNVHPTKVEVRFRDSQRVYSHLLSTLRQTFLKSDLHSRLQAPSDPVPVPVGETRPGAVPAESTSNFNAGFSSGPAIGSFELAAGGPDRQAVGSWFEPGRGSRPLGDAFGKPAQPAWAQSLPMSVTDRPGETFDEFTSVGPSAPGFSPEAAPEDRCPPNESAHLRHEAVGGPPRDESAIDSRSPSEVVNGHSSPRNALAPLLKAIQVHDSYLIAETGEGMMVIDQHALHERILYEEFRTRIAQGKMESQRLLVPEPVDMPAGDASALFEQSQILAELGLEVEPFGGDTVLVRSVPAILDRVGPERLVRDLAEHLRSQPLPPSRDGVLAELLHMMACKAAVKAGQPLSAPEITALLERRHLVADSHHCPHGRPTALIFTKADLEKQFGRI